MGPEKVLEVVASLKHYCVERGIEARRADIHVLCPSQTTALQHAHYLCDEVVDLVREGRMEKAFRHMSFAQCIFWSFRIFTIDDLMQQNRPDEDLGPHLPGSEEIGEEGG